MYAHSLQKNPHASWLAVWSSLVPVLPDALQCLLMSATSSEDVDRLTKLVLHSPLALNLLGQATGEGGEVS